MCLRITNCFAVYFGQNYGRRVRIGRRGGVKRTGGERKEDGKHHFQKRRDVVGLTHSLLTEGDLVSKETVCCVGRKVKH